MKLPQKSIKENQQDIKDLSLHYQLHQDSLTNPSHLIPNDPSPQNNFMNENPFNTQMNPNRMFFNVNQTLMMDLQQTQNPTFQNEPIMSRGFAPKPQNMPGLAQNFMRNPQYSNMQQQYANKQSFLNNMQPEKEKKWSISDSLNEKHESFLNTNKVILENEKIKKKINQGYFPNKFQMQNNNMQNPYQNKNNQNKNFENKGDNEFGNEAEFSPISPINFEVFFFF